MDVRSARPTDAPLALGLALDDDAHLVTSYPWPARNQVPRTVIRAIVPIALPGREWIAREGTSSGLLEAMPRRYVIGWDITRLVIRGDQTVILPPLVQTATDYLREKGVPRLFARCASAGCSDALKAAGFSPLAREYVLLGQAGEPAEREPLPVDSRYRMPQDAWPLHQLESDVTPALVRQMEGLTSLDWSRRIREMSEIVVERDGRVVCWIGWGVKLGRDLFQIGLLIHPQYRDVAPPLLLHALRNVPARAQVLVRVRDYQHDVLNVFLDAGFEILGEETLMVKHARVEAVPVSRRRIQQAKVPAAHIFNHSSRRRADVSRAGR